MVSVFVLLGGMVNVVEVFLVRETLHASATWYGVLGSGWGGGVLAGALLGGRVRGGSGPSARLLRLALVSAGGLSLSLAGMGLAPAVAWVLPAVLVGGLCNGLLNLAIGSLVGMRSADAVRGRVAAIVGGLASAGQVAMLLGGCWPALSRPGRSSCWPACSARWPRSARPPTTALRRQTAPTADLSRLHRLAAQSAPAPTSP